MLQLDSVETPSDYKAPLRYRWLTPAYDAAISLLTRESRWRSELIHQIRPAPADRIVDVGCGTGSLAVSLARVGSFSDFLGIDPDAEAIALARRKAAKSSAPLRFVVGRFDAKSILQTIQPNKIVSSLVLHQTPLEEKRRLIQEMFAALPARGELHIADYGLQRTKLARLLFRVTVQALDGVEDTEPNAKGVILDLLNEAGFIRPRERIVIPTLTGTISLYRGIKS